MKKKLEELCEREKRDEEGEVCWKRESGVGPVSMEEVIIRKERILDHS